MTKDYTKYTIEDLINKVKAYNSKEENLEKLRKLAELRLKAIMDEKDIYRAGKDEGIVQGIEQGIKQGIDQGKNEEKIEIAKKMIKIGLSVEQIGMIQKKKK